MAGKGIYGRLAKKRDANESSIVAALERVGAVVWRIDEPGDLLIRFRREWFCLEVKPPLGKRGGSSHSKLTPKQEKTHAVVTDAIPIVRTEREALLVIGAVRS
jgi:hypothetical protein